MQLQLPSLANPACQQLLEAVVPSAIKPELSWPRDMCVQQAVAAIFCLLLVRCLPSLRHPICVRVSHDSPHQVALQNPPVAHYLLHIEQMPPIFKAFYFRSAVAAQFV